MSGPQLIELDAQYRQLREECGLVEEAERGLLVVSGPEAAEYLQGQLTNDIEAIEGHTLLSLVGPRSAEIAGTAALPENACQTTMIGGAQCVAVGTASGIDLLLAAAKREQVREALLGAGAV